MTSLEQFYIVSYIHLLRLNKFEISILHITESNFSCDITDGVQA